MDLNAFSSPATTQNGPGHNSLYESETSAALNGNLATENKNAHELGQQTRQLEPKNNNSPLVQTYEPASVDDLRSLNSNIRINRNNQRQRQQRKLRAAIKAQENQTPAQSFPKYFLVKFPGTDLDTGIDVLAVDRDLKNKIGTPDEIKKHNRDTLLVKVKSRHQGNSLSNLEKLASYDVSVSENRLMNQSRGTVYSETMSNSTVDQLLNALSGQNVVNIERMKTRVNHNLVDTHRYIITFNQTEIPRTISLTDWHHELVELYVPRPMRCTKCQRFGHTHKRCRSNQSVCVQCGCEGHIMSQCNDSPKCVNCGKEHRASSNKCQVYIYKSEVLATQAKRNCTFREAEEQVRQAYREEGKQYNFVVKRQLPPPPNASQTGNEQQRRTPQEEARTQSRLSDSQNIATPANTSVTTESDNGLTAQVVLAEVHEEMSATPPALTRPESKQGPTNSANNSDKKVETTDELPEEGFMFPKKKKKSPRAKGSSNKDKTETSPHLRPVVKIGELSQANAKNALNTDKQKPESSKYSKATKKALEKMKEQKNPAITTSNRFEVLAAPALAPPVANTTKDNEIKEVTKKRDRELEEPYPLSKKSTPSSMFNPIPVIGKDTTNRYSKGGTSSTPTWK